MRRIIFPLHLRLIMLLLLNLIARCICGNVMLTFAVPCCVLSGRRQGQGQVHRGGGQGYAGRGLSVQRWAYKYILMRVGVEAQIAWDGSSTSADCILFMLLV